MAKLRVTWIIRIRHCHLVRLEHETPLAARWSTCNTLQIFQAMGLMLSVSGKADNALSSDSRVGALLRAQRKRPVLGLSAAHRRVRRAGARRGHTTCVPRE